MTPGCFLDFTFILSLCPTQIVSQISPKSEDKNLGGFQEKQAMKHAESICHEDEEQELLDPSH